jgi:hypothetical protein
MSTGAASRRTLTSASAELRMPAVSRKSRLISRALSRLGLRFPVLFLILLFVTVTDMLIPDILPFADEIVLAILTAIFGLWKDRRAPKPEPAVGPRPVRR